MKKTYRGIVTGRARVDEVTIDAVTSAVQGTDCHSRRTGGMGGGVSWPTRKFNIEESTRNEY
jgi:hypothetical protein